MAKLDDFNLKNLPPEAQDPEISADDFKLVQTDTKIHDQKFETKPTTFLKDCFRRFCKNKSSVVAAFILGFLLLLSVIVPLVGKTSVVHETDVSHPDIYYLEPKLFEAGTGFWDGTKKIVDVPVDSSDPDKENWWPNSESYAQNAISDREFTDETYISTPSKFGKDGFVQFGYYDNLPANYEEDPNNSFFGISFTAKQTLNELDLTTGDLKVTNFDIYNKEKLNALVESTEALNRDKKYPEGYEEANAALVFAFDKETKGDDGEYTKVGYQIELTEYKKVFNIGNGEEAVDVVSKFNDFYDENATEFGWTDKKVNNPFIQIRLKNENTEQNKKNRCVLIKSIEFESSFESKDANNLFSALSFKDGTECMIRDTKDPGLWINRCKNSCSKGSIYLSKAVLCTFIYDTYEAALGTDYVDISKAKLKEWKEKGWISYSSIDITDYKDADGNYKYDPELPFNCKILDPDNCPIAAAFSADDIYYDDTGYFDHAHCKVLKYRAIYELKEMPKFLLGTDKTGRDMFIYVFEGLRTSLLLGVATTVICFLFGLFWGSVSGYFGGTVDLIMERFTDILSGIPWIVVMTLTIIHLGSNFITFAIALCLTGWIGTAATTRTQFYRFRGREYVLASRTLGASHGRLIAKHILPNAMGTIITSAVLMVPSVIFSEATISYLGLGFKNLASLGVILSDNQIELMNHPYLLIFPSVIIALLMISFNLFGNGLRDAVNPSLKGEGE